MGGTPSCLEQLPGGFYRIRVYVGVDPITRAQAQAGREPESGATVGHLLDAYVPLAEWGVSTRETCEGYIRLTIRPALGHLKVRKVRGPILDQLYARLRKCRGPGVHREACCRAPERAGSARRGSGE
jgi:hypothetical protein